MRGEEQMSPRRSDLKDGIFNKIKQKFRADLLSLEQSKSMCWSPFPAPSQECRIIVHVLLVMQEQKHITYSTQVAGVIQRPTWSKEKYLAPAAGA